MKRAVGIVVLGCAFLVVGIPVHGAGPLDTLTDTVKKKVQDEAKGGKKPAPKKAEKAQPAAKKTSEAPAAAPAQSASAPAAAATPEARTSPPAAASASAPGASAPASAGPPSGKVLLLSDRSGGDNIGLIGVMTINPGTAAVTAQPGSPWKVKPGGGAIAVMPGGKFAYSLHGKLSVYAIDPVKGAMVDVPGSPFDVGKDVDSVAVDSTGTLLYAASGPDVGEEKGIEAGFVSVHAINPDTGKLALLDTPRITVGAGNAITISRDGKFAFVEGKTGDGGRIFAYTIDPKSHAFTMVKGSPFLTGQAYESKVTITQSVNGKFLYVVDDNGGEDNGNIWSYAINPTTGALTPLSGSPFKTGHGGCFGATDATGKFFFVANCGSYTTSVYQMDAGSGALTPAPGSPFRGGKNPESLAVDPSGRYLYVSNAASDDITVWAINGANGSLKEIAGSPFKGGLPNIVVR